ncbi:hypothetical protein TRVA0_036S00936 [Trichomonascus vanleenenianus]|uniref:uncharacterized protein n=1 Tax=Trichomonascus vanleenenianus TaxID=2268995 RepID=UPI003ECA785E
MADFLKGKVTPLKQMYHKWRALKSVPFRKKWFIGYDLDGNTFWEFQNYNDPLRMRRIVEYKAKNLNYVDYKIPPQWHQWLRHNRPASPTLEELAADKIRQDALKGLIREADERWKSIPLKKEYQDKQEVVNPADQKSRGKQIDHSSASGDDFQPQGWKPGASRR